MEILIVTLDQSIPLMSVLNSQDLDARRPQRRAPAARRGGLAGHACGRIR